MEKIVKKDNCYIKLKNYHADDSTIRSVLMVKPFSIVIMNKYVTDLKVISEMDNITDVLELKRHYSGRRYSLFPVNYKQGKLSVDTERKPTNEDFGVLVISRRDLRLKHPEYKLASKETIIGITKDLAVEYINEVNAILKGDYYDIEIGKDGDVQEMKLLFITNKKELKRYIMSNINFIDKEFDEILNELCE